MIEPEKIVANLEKIIFISDDNQYTVCLFKNSNTQESFVGAFYQQVTHHNYLEQNLKLYGNWKNHPKYGKQFYIQYYEIDKPSDSETIIRYLIACQLPGVGKKTAQKIVEKFEEKVFDILDEQPDKLITIQGISSKKIPLIKAKWQKIHSQRQIQLFLNQLDIGQAMIQKIHQFYKNKTNEVITKNPYQLCQDIKGIGFIKADLVATKLGLDKISPYRIYAAINYILQTSAENDGCVCLPKEILINKANQLLHIDRNHIVESLTNGISDELFISNDYKIDYIYLPHLFNKENDFTSYITNFIIKNQQTIPNQISHFSEDKLNENQHQAVVNCFSYHLSIITGGPGVGKTTTVKEIVHQAQQQGWDVALCAPTGRAAKRLEEISKIPAKTIHRLLNWNPQTREFSYNATKPLSYKLIIVDEASMLDLNLALSLCQAINDAAHLVLVGDVDQLPAIGPGSILNNLISINKLPVTKLHTIFRQEKNSEIIDFAYQINKGEFIPIARREKNQLHQLYWINQQNPEVIASLIEEMMLIKIPKTFNISIEQCQILTPMKKYELGTENLNLKIQQSLTTPDTPSIKSSTGSFFLNDRVMQTTNNYDKDVYNGDIGTIKFIHHQEKTFSVLFGDSLKEYTFEEKNQLTLSYAITVHKSQGSEFPAVIIPIVSQHQIMLYRKLLYTAVSRAQQLLILIGNKNVLHKAVNSKSSLSSYSLIKEIITENLNLMK